jgi:hypothetical protein
VVVADLQVITKPEILVDLDLEEVVVPEEQVIHLLFLHPKVIQVEHNNGQCQLIQVKLELVEAHLLLGNQDRAEEQEEQV